MWHGVLTLSVVAVVGAPAAREPWRADRRAGEKDEGTRLLCLFASIGSPKVRKRTSTLRRPMRHAKAPQSTDPPPDDLEDSSIRFSPAGRD